MRVERLQDISESDCWAEGIEECDGFLDDVEIINCAKRMKRSLEDAAPSYAALWESINGPGSWDANPWVWVIKFSRIADDEPEDESDDEGGYCPNCSGSGEGMTDGSTCLVCKGGVYS